MKKLTVQEQIKQIKQLPVETVLAIARISGGDGHTIYKPEAYAKAGMPAELVQSFTQTFHSDGTPKGSITNNEGKVVRDMTGIYGLNVIESLATAFDCKVGAFMGRGFRAQAA